MDNKQTLGGHLNFVLYANDTTLTNTYKCTFTQGVNHHVNHTPKLINRQLSKLSDWVAVNKFSITVDKRKFMIFHNHQRVIPKHEIAHLVIDNTVVERVTEFIFL